MKFTSSIFVLMLIITASSSYSLTAPDDFKAIQWDKSQVGTPLDLGKYKQTFIDNFDTLSVTPDGGSGPWFAPVHTTFGAAKFLPPGPGGPFFVADGKLTIRAEKKVDANGKETWTTGNMQTVDSKGKGFAQTNGYFEMSAKMPPGKGGWPSFWLLSQNAFFDKTERRTEIDVVEWYSGDPKGLHCTVHQWPAGQRQDDDTLLKNVHKSMYYNIASILTEGKLEGFHTYGTEITPEWVIMYFDRSEIGRFKMLPEMQTPLYMLVSLAMFEKEVNLAESPKELVVDYVAAYALKQETK